MAFYYFFPIICILIAAIGYKKKNTDIILMLVMLFFSMFRGLNVGRDTGNYIDEFSSNAGMFLSLTASDVGITKFELLYNYLCYLTWNYDLPPRTILYVLSLITFVFLWLSAKRFNVSTVLVLMFYVVLGYYFHSFNIARQLAALSIGLYGISFLKEDSVKRYIFFVCVIIASLIHNSLILFLALYLTKFMKGNRDTIGFIVFAYFIFTTLIPVTPYLIQLMGKMQIFYNNSYGSGGSFAVVERTFIGILFSLVNGILLMAIYSHRQTLNKRVDLLDALLLISMIVSSSLTYGNLGTNRVVMSFSVIQCIYFAECLKMKYKQQGLQNIVFAVFILLNYYMTIQIADGAYYLQFN